MPLLHLFGFSPCIAMLSGLLSSSCSYFILNQLSICFFLYRQIKGNCAESFTKYWSCLDYTNLEELRRCRKEQQVFDECVLDKLGWERPDLGNLSKVSQIMRSQKLPKLLFHGLYLCDKSLCACSFFRWPKCQPQGPFQKTPTILEHVPSPTQTPRASWNPPNMAAGYSSGDEAAPGSQSPSKAMRSVQHKH